jgi:hypothetical protein
LGIREEDTMNQRDASAMTEASGMTDRTMSASPTYAEQASQEALLRTVDLLRKMTMSAPLSSLAVAFMVGVLVARRR